MIRVHILKLALQHKPLNEELITFIVGNIQHKLFKCPYLSDQLSKTERYSIYVTKKKKTQTSRLHNVDKAPREVHSF